MLKRYYNIGDAAEFLTSGHKQNITRKDVLRLAMHGDIRLCAWFNENLWLFTEPFRELKEPGDYHQCGEGYAFSGYMQIPLEVIGPNGKEISFYPTRIIEAITLLNNHLPMKADPHGFFAISHYVEALMEYFPCKFTTDCDNALIPAEDLLNLSPNKQDAANLPADNPHKSDQLTMLNQASCIFWANVDKNDSGTHPKNDEVAAWLEKHGFTKTLAEKAATIIRPEWVPKGRKPEE